jgi:Ca-activated chloride channel family protein
MTVTLQASLSHPVVPAGQEPAENVFALLRLRGDPADLKRPRVSFTFLLDASATMYHFRLDPVQRAHWVELARARGDVVERMVDGRTAIIWTGQTMRELSDRVSTPMHCALRGLWRGLPSLAPDDPVCVIGFADQATLLLDDPGQPAIPQRLAVAQRALERLAGGAQQSGMGHNTRLAHALRLAFQRMDQSPAGDVLHRAVLVSDGQIEDRDTCLPLIEEAVERDLVISAIGVGDEFDEEFLMRIADETRGSYVYAPTARNLEGALEQEFAAMSEALARRATISVVPSPDVVFHDLYQVGPEMNRFPLVWIDESAFLYRLGNVSGRANLDLLASFAAPALPEGESTLGSVVFRGLPIDEQQEVEVVSELRLLASNDPQLAANRDDRTIDHVRRLEIYLAERSAQRARERGDLETATRHLHSATRMLLRMGDETLAAEMQAEAAAVGSRGGDQSRTKRIKSATRRLGESAAAAEPEKDTRRLPGPAAPPPIEANRPGAEAQPVPSDPKDTRRLEPAD